MQEISERIKKIKDELQALGDLRPGSLTKQYGKPKEKKVSSELHLLDDEENNWVKNQSVKAFCWQDDKNKKIIFFITLMFIFTFV